VDPPPILDWDQRKAAFLGLPAVSWGNKIDVNMQTPVQTTYPTKELETPHTKNENLNVGPPLLDGGQHKDIVCNMMHPENVMVLEGASETSSIGDMV
jgi:hypothetical protein